eukprot:12029236-Ditylum_brightwellii.AAC.1
MSDPSTQSKNTNLQATTKPQGTPPEDDKPQDTQPEDDEVTTTESSMIISHNSLPPHGWKEGHVYTIYKDEIEKLQDNKQEDFVTMKRETMRSLYKGLKVLARET